MPEENLFHPWADLDLEGFMGEEMFQELAAEAQQQGVQVSNLILDDHQVEKFLQIFAKVSLSTRTKKNQPWDLGNPSPEGIHKDRRVHVTIPPIGSAYTIHTVLEELTGPQNKSRYAATLSWDCRVKATEDDTLLELESPDLSGTTAETFEYYIRSYPINTDSELRGDDRVNPSYQCTISLKQTDCMGISRQYLIHRWTFRARNHKYESSTVGKEQNSTDNCREIYTPMQLPQQLQRAGPPITPPLFRG